MHRALTLVGLALAVLVAAFTSPVLAASFDPNTIVFPVDGPNTYTDTFGAPRNGHTHEGIDVMAAKMVPVVAAAAGTVAWISSSCCALALNHGGGWTTWYIHLNNDTPGTDDGKGWGIAPGIVMGTSVTAGQHIGWVGDSGNAESTAPHLHFEIRDNGTAINPYPYLQRAQNPYEGQFRDDDFSVHRYNIDKIYAAGITVGCNPPTNDKYCPSRNITRGEMAAFLARALKLSDQGTRNYFTDMNGHLFEVAVNKIMAAGIGFGCTPTKFCPDQPLLRNEMAQLLTNSFGYPSTGTNYFVDDNGDPFEAAINSIAAAKVTVGCNPPDNDRFCPTRQLSRAEMATFFVRALKL